MNIRIRHILLAVLLLVVVGVSSYKTISFATQFKNRIKGIEQELADTKMLNAVLFENYGRGRGATDNTDKPVNVLCLGNSITWHPRKDEIEWYSEWGMAASRIENDYCHQLEAMLRQSDDESSVTPLNIAAWELGLRSTQIDSLIGDNICGKDAVVIRLGENVSDKGRFEMALDTLVSFCQEHVEKVVLTGCFWQDDNKELSIIKVAERHAVDYVPLFWIDCLYNARPVYGDDLLDTQGNRYEITRDFIITHPNDLGHKMIAEEINKVL